MIENLQIDGFRGMDHLDLGKLGQFNLVVGPGGSGKTNLLEAIFLFCSNGDPLLLPKVLALRGLSSKDYSPKELVGLFDWFCSVKRAGTPSFSINGRWKSDVRDVCISKLQQDNAIPVHADLEQPGVDEHTKDIQQALACYKVRTKTSQKTYEGYLYIKILRPEVRTANVPNLHARFVTTVSRGLPHSLAPIWSQVEDRGEDQSVTELLRSLDPDISKLRIGSDEGKKAYLKIEHKKLGNPPLEVLGAGLARAVSIACFVVEAKGGILLIDEFDASLHVGAQSPIIEFTMKAAKRCNVQLFISTHSLETLDVFLDHYGSATDLWTGPEDFRVLQLSRTEDRTQVKNLDADKVKRLREEIGFDLRRTA